jgi:hypothetical protein
MIPARARRASLASLELGKAAATSGSKTTTALPTAYLEAYLLREPRLKSYSGRISSASDPSAAFVLLDDFFIIPSLLACGLSRADDAHDTVPIYIHDDNQTTVFRKPEQNEPLF